MTKDYNALSYQKRIDDVRHRASAARANFIQKELDALGIVDIRADSGILTTGIINDAIHAAKDLLGVLDVDSIADEIDN